MQRAGIDTNALLRSSLISFLEGALLHGVFHGDLHGGNLFAMPDGRTALLDFGITGRLDEAKRLAFLRLLVFGTSGDVLSQLAALRDLGAFPPDTDLEAVVADLGLDGPVQDPTAMSADELDERAARAHEEAARLRRPRAEGAHALREEHDVPRRRDRRTSRRTSTSSARSRTIYTYFQEHYGEQIAVQLGLDPTERIDFDMDAVKAGFGIGPEWGDTLTYAQVRERRETDPQAHAGRDREEDGS